MGGRMKTSSVKLPSEVEWILTEAVRQKKAVNKSDALRSAVRIYGFIEGIRKVPASA